MRIKVHDKNLNLSFNINSQCFYLLISVITQDTLQKPDRTCSFKNIACKKSVSPRSSPPGTFREEELLSLGRRRSSARNVPIGEERGETDV